MIKQLEVYKKFQMKYPKSILGGSFGLFLRGIDLKRNLKYSDLDITTPEFTPKGGLDNDKSSSEDFDFTLYIHNNNHYLKMDIRVVEDHKYDVVNYEGFDFNVKTKKDILYWKQQYAEKGVEKHIDDLITIATGVRPKRSI